MQFFDTYRFAIVLHHVPANLIGIVINVSVVSSISAQRLPHSVAAISNESQPRTLGQYSPSPQAKTLNPKASSSEPLNPNPEPTAHTLSSDALSTPRKPKSRALPSSGHDTVNEEWVQLGGKELFGGGGRWVLA